MQLNRFVYDTNLRSLEMELMMADFPEEVIWLLRQEMPLGWRENFYMPFDTQAFGCRLKGMLCFEQAPVNDLYRFASFELELPEDTDALVWKFRFDRNEGMAMGLREAVNLMHGRPVYRDYRYDRQRLGYWLELSPGEEGFEVVRSSSDFSIDDALDRGLFKRRLGSEACLEIAEALRKGDRVKVDVNGKTVYVEVLLGRERLELTNAAGRPAKLNWWELFVNRR